MPKASLRSVVEYCDGLLRPNSFDDWPGAVNGLQVENAGKVTHVAAAVDASLATVRLAAAAGADLLVVHHGLFWTPSHPWTGKRFELMKVFIESGLAVYSSHLPLDAHPKVGNNAGLARSLGFRQLAPFFYHKGEPIGFQASVAIRRDELSRKLEHVLGARPRLLPGGGTACRKIGIVTGGAGEELKQVASEGVDTFITGEGPHWTYAQAEELELNVFYGGHYATETFGVKALAAHISKRFKVPWIFLDHPTGL